jgi:chaperonin GroEL
MFGDRRRVLSGKENREELRKGVNLLADTVSCTLGPKGRNVICQRVYNKSRITKDGVTVAGEFFLEDPIQDIGAQIIKEASQKTAEEAGDGTTTSTVLARSIYNNGLNYLNEDNANNPVDVIAGIDLAVNDIVKNLKKLSIDINPNTKHLENVATISANNDSDLGKIVSEAVSTIGKDGKVIMENSKDSSTYFNVIRGTIIEQGFIHPVFSTSSESEEMVLNNPLIVVSNFKFSSMEQIRDICTYAYKNQRELLIIAEELDKEALVYVAENVSRGKIKMAVVRPPGVSNMRNFMLSDIAIITGGDFKDTVKGHNPKRFNANNFGSAEKVIVNRKQTVIIEGKGSKEEKQKRISAIQENIKNAEKGIDDRHKERLSKMFSGVATIYIGANSEVEQKEKKDRVEDAILATQSALEEGIVPGGGFALYNCIKKKWKAFDNKDIEAGYTIVMHSCLDPLKTIISNAGKNPDTILSKLNKTNRMGYNSKSGLYVENVIESGIIDPTKVARVSLINAASVAKTLLTTEATIYYSENHLPESIKMDPGNVK